MKAILRLITFGFLLSVTKLWAGADIVLEKKVDQNSPAEGQVITFTISVTNKGPANVNGLQIYDTWPSGLTYMTSTPSQGFFIFPVWNVGNLAVGKTATLHISAWVNYGTGGQSLTNKIQNIQSITDDNISSDDQMESVLVKTSKTDVFISNIVDNPTPFEGSLIKYTVSVQNNGPNNLTHVLVTDNLPAGLTLNSIIISQGTWVP